MFASIYDTKTKPAHELRFGDRVRLLDDNYKITAYGVPWPGMIKLYVEVELGPDGKPPHNPLINTVVWRNMPIPLAE